MPAHNIVEALAAVAPFDTGCEVALVNIFNRLDEASFDAAMAADDEWRDFAADRKNDVPKFESYVERAFFRAVRDGNVAEMKSALRSGMDVNASEDGLTAMHIMSHNGHVEAVRLLLSCGADATLETRYGMNALGLAALAGRAEVVRLLLQHGTDANAVGAAGKTALHYAASRGDVETARLLLQHGACVNRVSAGLTPLHDAAVSGNIAMTRLLLQHAANVNGLDSSGQTALHKAAYLGYLDVTRLLLEHGADAGIRDRSSGKTAADLVSEAEAIRLETTVNHSELLGKGYLCHNYRSIVRLIQEHNSSADS